MEDHYELGIVRRFDFVPKLQRMSVITKNVNENFYKVFCKKTQSKNGMWEQRFYTDGRFAPCWGYQIDETASVIYGVYSHYLKTKDKKFLKDNSGILLTRSVNYFYCSRDC